MNIFVKIGEERYPALITGKLHDKDWDDRSSKAIRLQMDYMKAASIFVDDVNWSIIQEVEELVETYNEETGKTIITTNIIEEEYDNSEYSIAGEIIDHRDGFVTIKMGMITAEELLTMMTEVM